MRCLTDGALATEAAGFAVVLTLGNEPVAQNGDTSTGGSELSTPNVRIWDGRDLYVYRGMNMPLSH